MAVALCVFGAATRNKAGEQPGNQARAHAETLGGSNSSSNSSSSSSSSSAGLRLTNVSLTSVVKADDLVVRADPSVSPRVRKRGTLTPATSSLVLQAEVGQGTYGTVRAARDVVSQQLVAVKLLPRVFSDIAEREVDFLERVERAGGHENIVRFLRIERPDPVHEHRGASAIEQVANSVSDFVSQVTNGLSGQAARTLNGATLLVFEFIRGEELFDRVVDSGPLSEDEAVDITRQTVRAVRFLHEKVGIVHADIKPENLLLTNKGKLKVCDFGSAMRLKRSEDGEETVVTSNIVLPGTAAYCAPEVLDKRGKAPLTSALDVWSLGCVLYVMLSGTHPFDTRGTRSDAAVARAVQREEVKFDGPVWDEVSDDAKDLLRRMLHKDPALRITLKQVQNHPFLRRHT
ncbi:Protein kinase, putative [Hondaea fermentalgiana]|uniref:Protein kinase, putative n=1 Tax=Hondaea fermentalgiana TaxID=2315210 RepID=A0A2R5G3V0_9STRA|nr:Protein kinase, putative [Hondaea fermentalgiana]|eukprot:GBG25692.1 Protein kinase, putative [Hondaea fermentalgiana]